MVSPGSRGLNSPLAWVSSFFAASNVTGLVSNTRRVSALLHRYGALSFWDCAAAAPYVEIEMYGDDPSEYKDAGSIPDTSTLENAQVRPHLAAAVGDQDEVGESRTPRNHRYWHCGGVRPGCADDLHVRADEA